MSTLFMNKIENIPMGTQIFRDVNQTGKTNRDIGYTTEYDELHRQSAVKIHS